MGNGADHVEVARLLLAAGSPREWVAPEKALIPRERRTAWRSCAGQRKHHEYFVSSRFIRRW
jgi:hypothetical protein